MDDLTLTQWGGVVCLALSALGGLWFWWAERQRLRETSGYVDPVHYPRPSARVRPHHAAPRVTGDTRSVVHAADVRRLRARVVRMDRTRRGA